MEGKNKDLKHNLYSTTNGSGAENGEITFEFLVQMDENQTVRITQKELYVLENWHRIYDAVIAKPPDERESFKYQENGQYSSTNKSNDESKQRTPGDGEENFSSGQGSDSDRSDTSSTYGSQENLPSSIELEQSKTEVNSELRLLWGLEENERKKKINRLKILSH